MLLKDNMDNWREVTVVNVVIHLNNDTPSSWDRRFPNWVKMVSLMSPLMDDLMQENMVLKFWMGLLSVQVVLVAVIFASVIEW